ncbi:tRNA pseudouridine(38-40) synthase TruA [Alicyclobacillus cycloheptanicus]|uniref:tRNA pseudouridine synthase A n=1 Tax=Alicyclobacillus cycloheptanicus TaxID=1457 RepID=A0ABT9XJF2_9BACL|nr:tRNA pseudouridine(38-40) synthase TruA [Alicyclobacillus cycloheptanicus]MDQ0190434.1 tRNA pseudouridine38-40 synthase [Alicyclobacillus cycloheptanicus]WDM02673.1 tRNA pseudouridine(38-40) synthase TruA [Alicyclobacillus cycloheptanicus]
MPKIRATVAYDGTEFHGFARQPGLRTVQGTLEQTLEQLMGKPVEVFGSGRTDAGVHARAQVVHWTQDVGPSPDRYPYVFRRILPPDIVVQKAEVVDEAFHARFSAIRKTYRYTVQRADVEDVFTNRYAWHMPRALRLAEMRAAAGSLVGEHDFTSFCAAATPVENKVRTVYAIEFEERGTYLDIYCTGSGFLQNMVRIIVGTLIDVGLGKLDPSAMPKILAGRDRRLAGQTAPAKGLCLWQVDYGDDAVRFDSNARAKS